MNDKKKQWERSDFNLRLSRQRLPKLKKLAAMLGPGATPMDAIDYALSRAEQVITSDRPEDIMLLIETLMGHQEQAVAELADRVAGLNESIEMLRKLMAQAVEGEDGA